MERSESAYLEHADCLHGPFEFSKAVEERQKLASKTQSCSFTSTFLKEVGFEFGFSFQMSCSHQDSRETGQPSSVDLIVASILHGKLAWKDSLSKSSRFSSLPISVKGGLQSERTRQGN